MIQKLEKSRYFRYEEFVKNHHKGHFMQSVKWAAMKPDWENVILVSIDDKNEIKGSVSLLIRKIPFIRKSIIYSPRGPVCDYDDKKTLRELYFGIKNIARHYNAFIFKCDPDIKADNVEFVSNLKLAGFKIVSGSKDFSGIQPCYVFRLNIKNKTPDEIFNDFHSKTRYNIRLAEKKGVKVRIGDKNDIKRFSELMNETGFRDKFVVRPASYFEKMLNTFDEHVRLYMAEYEGRAVAGTLAVFYGNKVWYLYGASGNKYRNLMPNYLLQWEMIKWACEKNCEIYDFRGVSGDLSEDNPLYGLYRFKKGFNGEFTEFLGEAQIIFSPFYNKLVNNGERIFRELRRKLYLLKGRR